MFAVNTRNQLSRIRSIRNRIQRWKRWETKFRDITGGVLSVFVLIADVVLFATMHNAMGLT